MSFCGCWNKIWIGVMVFSAVVCGILTHMSIRSGSLFMEFFLWWIKIVTVLSKILNSKILKINCFSLWIKTSNFHDFWPLPPPVGSFFYYYLSANSANFWPLPPKKRNIEWIVSNAEMTKVGHNFIKVLKKRGKQKMFSQTDILN